MRPFFIFFVTLFSLSANANDPLMFPTFFGEKKLLLVIGCHASGTHYISKVLENCGLDVKHEGMGKDGCVAWFMVKPSLYRKTLVGSHGDFSHIFHQIRHPLKVITSIYLTHHRNSLKYIQKKIPEMNSTDSRLVTAAKIWYYWNVEAARVAEWTYRVEDLPDIWDEFQKRLGKDLDKKLILAASQREGSRRDRFEEYLTWEELNQELDPELYSKIRSLAAEYGYIEKV